MNHLEEARRVQLERFRSMTPGERWRAAHDLYWSMRRLKAAFLRTTHPEWSEEEIESAVREAFLNARD